MWINRVFKLLFFSGTIFLKDLRRLGQQFFWLSVFVPCSKVDPDLSKIDPFFVGSSFQPLDQGFLFIFNSNVSSLGRGTTTIVFHSLWALFLQSKLEMFGFARKSSLPWFPNHFFNWIFFKMGWFIAFIHLSFSHLFKLIFFLCGLKKRSRLSLVWIPSVLRKKVWCWSWKVLVK